MTDEKKSSPESEEMEPTQAESQDSAAPEEQEREAVMQSNDASEIGSLSELEAGLVGEEDNDASYHHFLMPENIRAPLSKADEELAAWSLALPMNPIRRSLRDIAHAPSIEAAVNNETRDWFDNLQKMSINSLAKEAFETRLASSDAYWANQIEWDGKKVGAARPKISGGSGERISGEAAVMKITSSLGSGANVQVPLWHTGIWVSIKSPTEAAILELERRILREKVTLGRMTYGTIFSNVSAYTKKFYLEFIMAHIYDSTLEEFSAEKLMDVILTQDYMQLVWGMLCTMYPKGYRLAQPCTNHVGECTHVERARINFAKLSFVDTKAFTDEQRKYMYNRSRKRKLEEVKQYQGESSWVGATDVKINDRIMVDIKAPTLRQYIESGEEWISGIEEMIESSFAIDLRNKERDEYITAQGDAMTLRKYSHWISKITVDMSGNGDDFNYVDDRDTIERTLVHFSSDIELTTQIFEAITNFINSYTIAFVGIPNYECSACGKPQVDGEESRNLIPLELDNTFFTLLRLRVFLRTNGMRI